MCKHTPLRANEKSVWVESLCKNTALTANQKTVWAESLCKHTAVTANQKTVWAESLCKHTAVTANQKRVWAESLCKHTVLFSESKTYSMTSALITKLINLISRFFVIPNHLNQFVVLMFNLKLILCQVQFKRD